MGHVLKCDGGAGCAATTYSMYSDYVWVCSNCWEKAKASLHEIACAMDDGDKIEQTGGDEERRKWAEVNSRIWKALGGR